MINSHGLTDVGCIRERNEDRILADPALGLFIVADGMGGHAHGEMAAELGIATMQRYIESSRDGLDVTWPFGYNFDLPIESNLMITAVQLANRQVWRQAEQAPEFAGMGTTIAAALVTDHNVTIGNVGDSRVYLCRGGALRQLSTDDTWVKAVAGRTTGHLDASTHPLRSFLTQAAGSKDLVDVHISEEQLNAGDLILICSDGLHAMVPDEQIAPLIVPGQPLSDTAASLIQSAKSAGGLDNIAVVLIEVTE